MTDLQNTLFDLGGKNAIVTGASRGIGEAIARQLTRHGAKTIVSSRKIEACEQVSQSINDEMGAEMAHSIACNISHRADLENLVEEARAKLGSIDILVINAAVNPYYGPSKDITDEQFDKILNCNIKAAHWLSHLVLPDMVSKKDGAIIMISSIGGFVGSGSIGAYNISKAADLQMVRNLASEYARHNIRVNAICPGIVKTYFAEALWKDPAIEKEISNKLPARRFGEPDDIAGAAVFLSSAAGQWMHGQQIVIDGGALTGLGGL